MKWLKHMTASWDDEKFANLIGDGAAEGLALYGAYWRIAEIVASQMEGNDPSCSVSYPLSRWSRLLFVRSSYLTSILLRLQKEGLTVVEFETNSDRNVIVTMRNLLKYRDEYSKKSGQTPDNVPPRRRTEVEQKQKEKEKVPLPSSPTVLSANTVFDLPAQSQKTYQVTEEICKTWMEAYPAVNVMAELGKMKAWMLSNKQKMPTMTGVPRFVNAWLARSQNNAAGGNNGPQYANRAQQRTNGNLAALQALEDREHAQAHGDAGRGTAGGGQPASLRDLLDGVTGVRVGGHNGSGR